MSKRKNQPIKKSLTKKIEQNESRKKIREMRLWEETIKRRES